jgi:hypothetical protein
MFPVEIRKSEDYLCQRARVLGYLSVRLPAKTQWAQALARKH